MSPNEALCEACQSFKLDRNAFQSSPFEENRMHQLGSFAEASSRSCPLCRFITNTYRQGPVHPDFLNGCTLQGSRSSLYHDCTDAYLSIYAVSMDGRDRPQLSLRPFDDDGQSASGTGRQIRDRWIDIDIIKNWLRKCETTHACQSVPLGATRAGAYPKEFMVIDVQANCLIRPVASCRFLALSYLWAGTNKFQTTSDHVEALCKIGAFHTMWNQLSPTIRGAFELTRAMGERYLWIDSLCIQQDDEAKSLSNINAMDSIYRHAALVIVAADDRCPTDGLRGISSKPRDIAQFTAEVMPGLTLLARFHHTAYLEQSQYRTRGWTFQEEQLSTRAVVLLNDQAHFVCPSHVYGEDICERPDDKPDQSLVVNQKFSNYIREGIVPSKMYFGAVQNYTLRNLTYQSDALNAFRGIEAILCPGLRSNTIAGLPSCIFDIALLWQPTKMVKRRPQFPSWSWAGWEGPISWRADTLELASWGYLVSEEIEKTKLTTWLRNHTWIVWYHLHYGELAPVWSREQDTNSADVFWPTSGRKSNTSVGYDPEAATSENIYGRASALQSLSIAGSSQEPQRFAVESRLQDLPYDTHFLIFHTLTAKFKIQSSTAYLRYGSIGPSWEPNGRIVFLILNRHGRVCGYVLLDESWSQTPSDSAYDFLLLSEANYYCDWRRPHEDHPYTKYYGMESFEEFHVMMVKKHKIAPGLETSERAGLGRLHKEALGDALEDTVMWKEVILR